MSDFIQIHMLTSYPPACLNRDDLNRPKTARMGGKDRLRISSQCLKRAWRTSDLFEEALAGHLGRRTKKMGVAVYEALTKGLPLTSVLEAKGAEEFKPDRNRVSASYAKEWARKIAAQFGKLEDKPKGPEDRERKPFQHLEIKQLAHFGPEEIAAIDGLLERISKNTTGPEKADLMEVLKKKPRAADIAMFGRMLTEKDKDAGKELGIKEKEMDISPFGTEAAVQVAHAISVHEVAVEDDYFSAVDDLNIGNEGRGSAHIDQNEFGAGLFYTYICVNKTLLDENLRGDVMLANQALRALVEAAAKVAPSGKQNSFGSRAYAAYILAEKGKQQPRSLSLAFLKPVTGRDFLADATTALRANRENMEKVYGPCADSFREMSVVDGKCTFNELLNFISGG
jgi:CRISPR system Cascade subunit CasC